MCGQYQFSDSITDDSGRMVGQINGRLHGAALRVGDIQRTDLAAALVPGGDQGFPVAMTWGFPHFSGKGVIVNARCESASQKGMFRDSLLLRRCAVPATCFYESKKEGRKKVKHRFTIPGHPLFYMAGCYCQVKGENTSRFVILTTEANDSVRDIHDRMPVVLLPEERERWLSGEDFEQLFDRRDLTLEANPVS